VLHQYDNDTCGTFYMPYFSFSKFWLLLGVKLAAIEAFDDAKEAEEKAAMEAAANEISTDERIATALEAQVLMSMPDEEI
jgi:hypothetical protein